MGFPEDPRRFPKIPATRSPEQRQPTPLEDSRRFPEDSRRFLTPEQRQPTPLMAAAPCCTPPRLHAHIAVSPLTGLTASPSAACAVLQAVSRDACCIDTLLVLDPSVRLGP